MKPMKTILFAAIIPIAVLSGCSDSDSKDKKSPFAPTPVDNTPDDVTTPIIPPVTDDPQQPDTTPSFPTDPDIDTDTGSSSPDPIGGNNNNAVPTVGNPIANSKWYMCSGIGPSYLYQYSFTTTEYSYIYAWYDMGDCQGTANSVSEMHAGTYTLGNTITTTDGLQAIELDLFTTRLLGTEMGNLSYAQYDIIHVNGNVMYVGYLPEEEKADRPQALNFDDEYRRYQ